MSDGVHRVVCRSGGAQGRVPAEGICPVPAAVRGGRGGRRATQGSEGIGGRHTHEVDALMVGPLGGYAGGPDGTVLGAGLTAVGPGEVAAVTRAESVAVDGGGQGGETRQLGALHGYRGL